MNPTQDQLPPTPDGEPNASAKKSFPTPNSVMDELHYNRKPASSGKSPRQEERIRRKMASKERFWALVDSIHKADGQSMHDDSRNSQSESTEHEGKVKRRKKARKSSHHTTPSAASATGTNSGRRIRESSTRRSSKIEPKDSSNKPVSGPWGIKSVVSNNMDKWMPFDDDTDFSESNHESYDSSSKISSEVEYLAQTLLLELTPRSVQLDASRSSVTQASTPNPQRHPSLGRMVVMDSGMSHSSRSSSHRRKSKKSSSRRVGDPKRPGVSRSNSSSRSMNPTPSVIAAGVQEVAAKLDVDMSPKRSQETEMTVSPLLDDDNSIVG